MVLPNAVAVTTSPDLATTLGNLTATPHAVELREELWKKSEDYASGSQS